MRNTLPLLSRAPAPSSSAVNSRPSADTPPQAMPTIRLISATPSATGSAADASGSTSLSSVAPFATSSPLSPRTMSGAPRKRLVPKKSRLGLLAGVAGSKVKDKVNKDFSDVVRRVGGDPTSTSSGRGGFEIYVDHAEDEELGEILVVKKKKSRMGLDSLRWGGTLGEVTNAPAHTQKVGETLVPLKVEESQKWWSIGRGRKDSKDKDKDKENTGSSIRAKAAPRSQTPEPAKSLECDTQSQSRARFNSLDSGIMLSKFSSPTPEEPAQTVYVKAPRERTATSVSRASKSSNGLLAPEPNPATGSIAVRAIKSMRSLARMASWAQLTNNGEKENAEPAPSVAPKTIKEKSEAGKKKKERKGKDGQKAKEDKGTVKRREKEKVAKEGTVRYSSSSFEAGALSTQASPQPPQLREGAKTLGRKKQSTLGLGLPSTMRLTTATATATMRKVSNASSMGSADVGLPQAPARLSVDSAHLIMNAHGRPTSIMSSGSSLRPPSTASAISERSKSSSSSSVASVRWDDEGIRSSRELQRQERKSKESARPRESRRASDGRRRAAIVDIFPETQEKMGRPVSTSSAGSAVSSGLPHMFEKPIVNVESATSDGHSDGTDSVASETPAKKRRPRPVSEQMLGRPRPSPINEDPEVMLSMLDAATNELASLINRLDLEATPGSTNGGSPLHLSPGQHIFQESPVKQRPASGDNRFISALKGKTESMQSLRPYAQLLSAPPANKDLPSSAPPVTQQFTDARRFLGQQIAPWSELDWQVSPKKPVGTMVPRPTHKRTNTPTPALDPPFVFQPLRPAKNNKANPAVSASLASAVSTPPIADAQNPVPSSSTFGSRPSKIGLRELAHGERDASPTPVFKRSAKHIRKGSSLATMSTKASEQSLRKLVPKDVVHISPEARRGLGLAGTLGGRVSNEPVVDPEDPDSDIPNELQVIIAGQSDDDCTRRLEETFSRCSTPASPISPPAFTFPMPLPAEPATDGPPSLPPVPVFQLFDEDANHADIDSSPTSPAEDDTKKSFDFTGELRKLNESGGSDRHSFVEQLENAFRTPAKIELDYGLGEQLSLDNNFLAVPPVPPLPLNLRSTPGEDLAPRSVSNQDDSVMYSSSGDGLYRDSYASDDIHFDMVTGVDDECRVYPVTKRSGSMRSMASDGQLNVDFRFGGKPTVPTTVEETSEHPLTLSDIIPPSSHSASRSSVVEEDSSVLKSIMAKAAEHTVEEDSSVLKSIMAEAQDIVEVPRRRALSESSSKRVMFDPQSYASRASNSDHFRRESEASFAGFESFEEVRRGFEFANRPAFYPPPGANTRRSHFRDESLFSIASVSSYGDVLHAGAQDPFGYGLSRPASSDISMAMSVDDTFSFMHRGRRQRIDSDASSFYFRAPGTTFSHGSRRAGHRRDDSRMSVVSNAPPVSMYNRSFGGHRRNDSNMSTSSVAQSYAMHGASGGRAAWARHRQDQSVDSVWSDYSAARLGRPGLGDKMFDNEHGMPLSAISASPPESVAGELRHRPSWESFDPTDRRAAVDSMYEDSEDYHTTMSRDSVFGNGVSNSQYYHQLQRRPFRPVSVISDISVEHPCKEDDTMITMFDGARVRRLSVDSRIGGSPCVRIEKAKQSVGPLPQAVLQFRQPEAETQDSPNTLRKSMLVEKPSIASTSSHQFGGERMIKARKGLLERQSLEDSALIGQGEDVLASLRSQSVFSRPDPASRSRSSTISASSGIETPPLSLSDGSSQSGGSQSSIDIGHLNALLLNATHPSSGAVRARRPRARGTGHRRRISQARASRTSVYETIEEESSFALSPSPAKALSPISSHAATPGDSVFIVDEDNQSMYSNWDDERGITTLRNYCALKEEAHETVVESKRLWVDTPFSVFAVQSFCPPQNRGGMCAMLEHSQKNYGPLPSDLRPRRVRSRTSSRASPYPLPDHRISFSPEQPFHVQVDASPELHVSPQQVSSLSVLREVSGNVKNQSPVPALHTIKPFTPFSVQFDKSKPDISQDSFVPPVPARPRVTSSVRRNALGWKRQTGKSSSSAAQKENANQGMLITPSETLRINRPRPQRGRPTPARASAHIA